MGKKFGFSFSAKRALGISAAKGKVSRAIGIPLTRSGRERKYGRNMLGFFFPSPRLSRRGEVEVAPKSGGGAILLLMVVAAGCYLAYRLPRASVAPSNDATPMASPKPVAEETRPADPPAPDVRRQAAIARLLADSPEYRIQKMNVPIVNGKVRSAATAEESAAAAREQQALLKRIAVLEDAEMARTP
jgi:hypothetical protein